MSHPEKPITLEEFVADVGDRDRSEIFAGRADELGFLHGQVATMRGMWERRGKVGGSIRIVSGCPGIGKTALLRRFADECRTDHLVVEATLDDMESVAALTACVVDSGRGKYGVALDKLPNIGHIRDLARFVRAAVDLAAPTKGVILLLDEAQQVAEGHHNSVIHYLHTGSQDQPVFPVFFGLDDTRDSLERAGASRIPTESRIGLSTLPGEDAEAVLRNFERLFGVRTPPDLADRLLRDSQGFPQHLNSALRSLGEEWLRAGGRVGGLDAGAVLDKAKARREAYYEGRLDGSFGRNTRLAAAAADLAGRGEMDREGLIDVLVGKFVGTLGRPPGPATDKAAEDFFRSIVRRGLLAPDANGVYRTPIPSFLKWLREKYPDPAPGGIMPDPYVD